MSNGRSGGTDRPPRGRPLSAFLVVVAVTAFIAGGVALIFGVWLLVYAMAAVFVTAAAVWAVIGLLSDTASWTMPLTPRSRRPQGRRPGAAPAVPEDTPGEKPESDVAPDPAEAGKRATGGKAESDTPDRHSTTGTSSSGMFVGRVAGDDSGYAEETGAEARAEAREAQRRSGDARDRRR